MARQEVYLAHQVSWLTDVLITMTDRLLTFSSLFATRSSCGHERGLPSRIRYRLYMRSR